MPAGRPKPPSSTPPDPHHPDKPVLSIGRPTPNNTVYVLDDDLTRSPSAKGEMWAGGVCCHRGLSRQSELTAERHPDPFRPGHLMFRTRDLGRWTRTGEARHFGRVDDLVKIHGFRVEVNAVSRALEGAGGCTGGDAEIPTTARWSVS
ncbi:MAG: AMP-binding protein [Paracoccaceae bacterium]